MTSYQLKLIDEQPTRSRQDYPQIDRIDENGTQWIELNRGCKRGCSFCYADQNYKQFKNPPIRSNIVQIVGEGFLYDTEIKKKISALANIKNKGRVVRYGLSQGIDYRLLEKEIAELMVKARIGIINNKGRWYKGMRFAWDLGMEHEQKIRDTVKLLESVGYIKKCMQIFVLVNWKIPYEICMEKLKICKELGVKIDDCTWNTTKREMYPRFWTLDHLKDFRKRCRQHNIDVKFSKELK